MRWITRKRERERKRKRQKWNNRVSREQGRDAAAERRIKVSSNVIYGIDLNPAFKPRAIIQSRSPFPSFSTFTTLPFPLHPRLRPPPLASAVYYPSRARSILNIYLGIYPSYSRGTRPRIIYTRIANPVDSLKSCTHCLLRLRTDFFMGLSRRSALISRLVISAPVHE